MGGGWRVIVVREDVYLALRELKTIYNANSYSDVIRRLIKEVHGGGVDANARANTHTAGAEP